MIVQLILAAGSRAGTVAQIHPGYYMIGRDSECQIRPKSRSVSRRHCLVYHGPEKAKVFDLNSTSGTKVNQERIEPRSWVELQDGDELRLGKVAFSVVVDFSRSDSHEAVAGNGQGSMVQGAPWQEADIAEFLEAQDDEDRARRYDLIRKRSAVERPSDDDADVLDDEPFDSDEMAASGTRRSDSSVDAATDDTDTHTRGPIGKLPARKKRRASRLSKTSSVGSAFDVERLKFYGAVLLAVAVLSFLGYKVYEFQSGPDVRVIEEID